LDQILIEQLKSERVREGVRATFADTFGVSGFDFIRPRVETTLG
jgi:hypothetical protein